MTTEAENAINVLVQSFLLEQDIPNQEVTNAFASIKEHGSLADLGRAVYIAMLKTHVAKLKAEQATLVAQLPRGNIH